MADDQNRLDVAELTCCLLICEGINATSITPTTRLRMTWNARQVEGKTASRADGMGQSVPTQETRPLSPSLEAGTGPPARA